MQLRSTASALVLFLCSCRSVAPTRSTTLAPPNAEEQCIGPPQLITQDAGHTLFPVLLPIPNARPSLRSAQSFAIPTRMLVQRRDARSVDVSVDQQSLEGVSIEVGCNMIVGSEVQMAIVRAGETPSPQQTTTWVRGTADFSQGTGQSFVTYPAQLRTEDTVVLRVRVMVFETDLPPQHEWSPQGGNYRSLWERTFEVPIH